MNKISTLTDFVFDHIASNFSVRPDTLDSIGSKVRLAVVELQKENLFPETTLNFTSIDMKEEKRDSADRVIYNYYNLPKDFRQLYNNGPALQVGEKNRYRFIEYGRFITHLSGNRASQSNVMSINLVNGEHGKRYQLIVLPFPGDDEDITITYYSNGVDMPIEHIDEQYYMPVINHVLHQMGLIDQMPYNADVIKTKRSRQSPAGQGTHNRSFAQTKPQFFNNHRKKRFRR